MAVKPGPAWPENTTLMAGEPGHLQLPVYKEGDLEDALIDNISTFLLELGKGFAFIGRQQRINIGGRIFKVDLVFYHRILKCFVLIDLKRGEVQHEDIGQMNLYLNYYREEMNTRVKSCSDPVHKKCSYSANT